MGFILLTFLTAFGIEGLGTYVSIIGLSTLFGANPIIMAIAIALDVGKLLVVSLLYTYWKKLGIVMKSYALIAAVVTMTITSTGAMGYLSGEFQKAIMGSQENTLKVDVLKTEQVKLEDRKKQIDLQIANLPKNFSNSRIKLMKEFGDEQKQITDRLTRINADLPTLQIAQISVEAKVGPILYISKAFGVPVEVAVKYVILMIIFVFDPLAVFLIIAGNFLLHLRRVHKDVTTAEADLFEEPKILADISQRSQAEEPVLPPTTEAPFLPPSPSELEAAVEAPLFLQDALMALKNVMPLAEHEGPMAKTNDDDHVEREYIGAEDPLPPAAPEVIGWQSKLREAPVLREAREIITREQLQPPQYFSTLGAIKADDTVTFDSTPAVDVDIASQYTNLK